MKLRLTLLLAATTAALPATAGASTHTIHRSIVKAALVADQSQHPNARAWRVWCQSTPRATDAVCVFHWKIRAGGPDHHQTFQVTIYRTTPVGDGWRIEEVDFLSTGPERVTSVVVS